MMRKVGLKVLPLLVVAWATLAVVGGAAYLGNKSKAADKDVAVKTGLGLCAVSVALLVSTGVRPKLVLPGLRRKLLPKNLAPLCTTAHPMARWRPPSLGPPILRLLQVSRT